MSIINRFTAVFDALNTANQYSGLFRMSDVELATRGLSREGLTRCYMAGLGGR